MSEFYQSGFSLNLGARLIGVEPEHSGLKFANESSQVKVPSADRSAGVPPIFKRNSLREIIPRSAGDDRY